MAKTKEEIQADLDKLIARRGVVYDLSVKCEVELTLIDERISDCQRLLSDNGELKSDLPTEDEIAAKVSETVPAEPIVAEPE